MERQQEYLRLLQERNRLKKMMTEKTEEELMKEELERGFSIHFRGAHAGKEKNASNRFEGKPNVKVHKSPNQLDLVRRLGPSNMSEGNSNDLKLSAREEYRSTPRVADRSVSFRATEQEEEFTEEYETQEPLPNLKPATNDAVPDVNQALLGQITSMSEEQKLALLQLLQANVATTSSAKSPKSPQIATYKSSYSSEHTNSNQAASSEEPDENRIVKENNVDFDESPPLPAKKPVSGEIQGDINTEEVIPSNNSNRLTLDIKPQTIQAIDDVPINLKIKISTTWKNSKNVFLQGLRLRFLSEDYQGQSQYIDLFQYLKAKLLQGMMPVNATNDSFRLINNLLGVGLTFKSALWKSAISAQNPVELVFEGSLPHNLFQEFIEQSKVQNMKELLHFIELSCWNGYEEDSVSANSSINASAAKDVDIFVNDVCVWTGELSAENSKVEILRAMDSFNPFSKNERKATMTIKPFLPRPKTSTTNRISLERPISGRKTDDAFVKKLFGSPTRSKPLSPAAPNNFGTNSAIDDDKPDWLKFSKENSSKQIILTPSSKERRLDDTSFRSPERLLQQNDEIEITKSPNKSANKNSKGQNRRRRAREVGSFDAEAGITLSPKEKRVPKTLNEISKELDSNLRKSIEAVEHSEKFNLNRLETTVARNPAAPKRVSVDPIVNSLQYNNLSISVTDGGEKTTIMQIDKEVTPANVLHAKPDNHKLGTEISKPPIGRSGSSGNLVGEKRAAKIEQVNAKLNTALTDLAEILAGLPKQPPLEEENVDTIDKMKAMDYTPRVIPAANVVSNNTSIDLPRGTVFVIEILTTHGDTSYVGLNGLEFFNGEGNNILAEDQSSLQSIAANPMDLGVLPGYSDDPRKAVNLIDGINNTKDDLHQWLAPHLRVVKDFLEKQKSPRKNDASEPIATITVTFTSEQVFSMLKIYNFNKSRTHNQRGVRDIRILLDGKVIFTGVIKKATGFNNFSEDDYQIISFTSNEKIIQHATPFKGKPDDEDIMEDSLISPKSRPRTSDGSSSKPAPVGNNLNLNQSNSRHRFSTTSLIDEVLYESEEFETAAGEISRTASFQQEMIAVSSTATTIKRTQHIPEEASKTPPANMQPTFSAFSCLPARNIKLELESSWGDQDYLGLNGVEILGSDGLPLPLSVKNIVSDPNSSSFGFQSLDERKVDNIVNGINNTANDQFMWLIVREHSRSKHFVEFDMKKIESISGIRIWNYNGSSECYLRGCKYMTIYLDKKPYFRFIVRPAPEYDGVDFHQTIFFSHLVYEIEQSMKIPKRVPSYITPRLKQTYETSVSLCGLLWKFTFLTNHGDDYYIGLDHIDFFDVDNQIISLDKVAGRVAAVPYSVRDLSTSIADPLFSDPRIPERLFDSTYFTDTQKKTCWLSPLSKCMTSVEREACVNRITNTFKNKELYLKRKRESVLPKENTLIVLFPYPTTVSAIRIYNYSKSADRGVCDYSLHVDGNMVYMGSFVKANDECPPHHSKAGQSRSQGQIIVFSNEPKALNAHKDLVAYYNYNEQDVLCINERQVMVRSKTMYDKPGITADLEKRPTTSYFS